ncbi:MAG: histidine kinase [Chitinophagales bacterium]|nr:histidine kinase [Chitinophagales bacterium]
MNKKWIRIILHCSFWAVYLPLHAFLDCINSGKYDFNSWAKFVWQESFTLPVKIGLTYFVFYYIIPLYLDRSKVGKMVGLTFLSFLLAAVLHRISSSYIYFYFNPPAPEGKSYWEASLMVWGIFDLYITVMAAAQIKMLRIQYKSQEFEEKLLREKLQSELNFLRAQVNPHFLFNTLNNLYMLARKKSEHTAGAIMQLSGIMRFVLDDCRSPLIPLQAEAKIIKDLISLNQLRYNDRVTVVYEEQLDAPDVALAPLLLLPFVENSFKHGADKSTGPARIHIHLEANTEKIVFDVINTTEEEPPDNENPNERFGIGLQNVERQLDLIYPGRHQLLIENRPGQYAVHLEIQP